VEICREHQCEKRHDTYRSFAKCALRKNGISLRVLGNGEYASLNRCGESDQIPTGQRRISAYLYPSPEAAGHAKAFIDSSTCGTECQRRHAVVRFELPGR
jgi:hypothetical protein